MTNEITFDKLPQAVGYLTEQVERIHKILAALQPQTVASGRLARPHNCSYHRSRRGDAGKAICKEEKEATAQAWIQIVINYC